MSESDLADALATTREYVAVRPTTDSLAPKHATNALRSLHGTVRPDDAGAIEMLLVTGHGDGISYLFGADGVTTDHVERTLRRCFPTTYELTPTDVTLADRLTKNDDKTLDDGAIVGLEVQGRETRAGDWKTRLRPLAAFSEDDRATWPLTAVVDALANTSTPIVFQTLLGPEPDWTAEARETVRQLHYEQGTVVDKFIDLLIDPGRDPKTKRRTTDELSGRCRQRIEEIEDTNTQQSFHVNTRAIAVRDGTTPGAAPLNPLSTAFSEVGQTTYQLTATRYDVNSPEAKALAEDLATRTLRGFARSRRVERWCKKYLTADVRLPLATNTHPKIVADPETVGNFCLLGGADLPEPARRAIGTRPGERTGQPLPPSDVLDSYRGPGYTLGHPKTGDRVEQPDSIALPPRLQRRHMLVAGRTGSGKSIWGVNGLLDNHDATDGATIIIESKDGQMADDYERAHYAEYGTLEDVYRFDASEVVPATPFFDVTRQQESGVPRSQAVEDVADHTQELLRAIMGPEAYDSAVSSPLVIEALIKSLFDPVHGHDQFTLEDLQRHTQRFAESGHAPPVSDSTLKQELRRIEANSEDTFTEIMSGAARRIAQAALDSRVAPLFDYAPEREDTDTEPFDWRARLDEDCVVIIDTSDLREEPQRVVTLVVLSQLWTALQRREAEAVGDADHPLVNVHVEEAADVAASGIVADLLQKGRSYDVGVTLSLQYPRQLKRADEATYEEALNNIGTVVAGGVEHDRALAERLATEDTPPEEAANRLRGLAPGEWLVSLPAAFGDDPPRPFQVESGPLPPGHPDGPDPLSETEETTLEGARTRRRERERRHGISVIRTPATQPRARVDPDTDGAESDARDADPADVDHTPLETTLPFTRRLPEGISYHGPADAIVCDACDTRHGRRLSDLLAALECHGDLAEVDRADVPTVDVGLTLSPGERAELPYSDAQLVFLQVVYNAHQQIK
ncbi:MAG: ATP-binding protein [Haloarculaceae archaeon]